MTIVHADQNGHHSGLTERKTVALTGITFEQLQELRNSASSAIVSILERLTSNLPRTGAEHLNRLPLVYDVVVSLQPLADTEAQAA